MSSDFIAAVARFGLRALHFLNVVKADSAFDMKIERNSLTSLKARCEGAVECIQTNPRLGDLIVRWRTGDTDWVSATNSETGKLTVDSRFKVQDSAIVWAIHLRCRWTRVRSRNVLQSLPSDSTFGVACICHMCWCIPGIRSRGEAAKVILKLNR